MTATPKLTGHNRRALRGETPIDRNDDRVVATPYRGTMRYVHRFRGLGAFVVAGAAESELCECGWLRSEHRNEP